MKTQSKKAYITPRLKIHGSFEYITKQGGAQGVDGIIGVDIDGDGTVDAPTGVTTGSI